ncbi:LsmAD domain-containing protein [Mycena indigotica]|uniref:LsmAD domain-containing protein n=1 Tax=Mycena indigotica TaxID=2126181 RepID=A0A8H6TAF1_9AGAR|nr:LsmAD domain-containing protein [Mycena indigotica]KAF7312280.1 LsmAD domain-containing protein [Mycena indigotica]
MATTARQPKPQRKGAPEPARRQQQAWTGARASPTFSPSTTPQPPASFPPLNGSAPQDRVLQSLAGLTGTTITLSTKTNARYEGVIASTSNEGDTTGVTLRDVKELTAPGGPLKDTLFIAATNINDWSSGPADAKATNGDSFRTDTDISQKKGAPRERELQAWQPSTDVGPNANAGGLGGDDETFGAGSTSKGNWDQFNANEKLFGVKTSFDEDVYTTKLDRNAPDFKERERKAQRIANEIQMTGTNNPHIAEERNQNSVDDSGLNEEDKYGAVVRGANAYVPPGARKPDGAKSDVPKVSVNGPDGTSVANPSKSPSPAPSGAKPDPVTAFSDFVTDEKRRLQQKRQALVKNDMDKRMADLVKFSESFKLNKPIPDDLVPILTKDADKQRQIKEKSTKDANAPHARNIGASSSSTTAPGAPRGAAPALAAKIAPSKGPTAKPSPAVVPKATPANAKPPTQPSPRLAPTGKPAIPMVIQSIPPFKGNKTRQSSQPTTSNGATSSPRPPNMTTSATTSALSSGAPPSPSTAAARQLNAQATSFKPTPKGAPSASVSPKPKNEAPTAPNPFFGSRPIKKNTAAHIKDDFNPFKHNKVAEAAQVSAMWPYNGKRYMLMFPQQPPQPHPHQPPPQMPPPNAAPMPVPPPPPYAEEEPAAAAARGYVYYPYYPGQMLPPGMVPQPGPPYMQYMQPMPYPPGMPPPPNAMYASPSMGQMPPPPQVYMQPPPPGAYPPPNGAGPRPSMPPTPIPPHPYYQQSPQLGHAVAYPMMMQQPPTGPVHGYEAAQGQMGQHS